MASDRAGTRRRYDDEHKAQVVAECDIQGASVAKVAMSQGINANVVRRWRQLAREARCRGHAHKRVRFGVACTAGRCSAGLRHPDPAAPWRHRDDDHLTGVGLGRVRRLDARAATLIRVDNLWLAVEPLDMRSGTEAALARVVKVFGAARPHHAYLFANRRANRMKVLVHDGIGVWLAARRLNSGRFVWPKDSSTTLTLTRAQFDALVLGLPWQRIGEAGIITIL